MRCRSATVCPVVRCDIATSELIKVAANAFLATKISFINAMAQMCRAGGDDLAADALGYDERIGRSFLNAGLGFGGGCLPKDIAALAVRADELGVHVLSNFIRSVEAINAGQRTELAELAIDQAGGSVAGKRIAVLGAAFKPGTDDTRNSPALTVADQLHASGADVRIDPQASLHARRLHQVASVEQALLGADVVLQLTEWPPSSASSTQHASAIWSVQVIIDGRLKLHAPTWRNAGWKLVQIGRATSNADLSASVVALTNLTLTTREHRWRRGRRRLSWLDPHLDRCRSSTWRRERRGCSRRISACQLSPRDGARRQFKYHSPSILSFHSASR